MLNHTKNGRRHGRGLSLMLGCLMFAVCHFASAQYNLVQNHSFEETDSCSASLGFHPGPTHWFSAGGTPDYLLRCVPYGSINGVPLNRMTFQEPQIGDAYIGIITYYVPQGMEYAMTQLIEPLVPGQNYDVSFFANTGFGGNANFPQFWLATSNVGVLFTMEPRQWTLGDPMPMPVTYAHMYHPAIISDTIGWTHVSGTFVADSAYQYLMIGNHFENANTDTLHLAPQAPPPAWFPGAYTLIDNVSVSRNTTGISDAVMEGVKMYPNPTVDEFSIGNLPTGSVVSIHDALGRRIWEGGKMDGLLTLDVGSWARGAYLLRVQANGRQGMFKFVLIDR